jgi:outer membrane protein with beta-barrel domain
MRTRWLVLALWLLSPTPAAADWQVRPFIGFEFGGATTFQDPEGAIGTQNAVVGLSGGWLGEIFGLEADFGRAPGFFQRHDAPAEVRLLSSAVTTLTGNVVIALPRRLAGYGLRPYFSGGAGLMHVDMVGKLQILEIHRTLPTLSLGGGVTGFLTNRVGLNWDIRRLSTVRGEGETIGNSLGREQLSFWRATMAVALRY